MLWAWTRKEITILSHDYLPSIGWAGPVWITAGLEELKRSYQMQAFIWIDGRKFQMQIGLVSLEIEGEEKVMLPVVLRI